MTSIDSTPTYTEIQGAAKEQPLGGALSNRDFNRSLGKSRSQAPAYTEIQRCRERPASWGGGSRTVTSIDLSEIHVSQAPPQWFSENQGCARGQSLWGALEG